MTDPGGARRAAGLVVAGTSSDAGKSALVAGMCRELSRRGLRVVPFKAQNMSNNSMVCRDGSEIGRAQYLQAQAARVEASSAMNPVLLKPGTDRRSFVVVRGRPAGVLEAGEYATGRRHLAEAAFAAYRELAAGHDMVICEGAGSPAEINLRSGDYVNMGLAQEMGLPVLVVGDIDRGGMLASLYGTWAVLDEADRALLSAFVVNKFRGDVEVLRPGLVEVTRRTGVPFLGVLPWLEGLWIDGEDALEVARWRSAAGVAGHDPSAPPATRLQVAVVRFPRISNATDLDALAAEPGVDVAVTTDPDRCERADLLILPGTRSTVDDLAWLRARGLATVVTRRAARGRPVLGICGGYQMLAGRLSDQVETAAGHVDGLGLLPTTIRFDPEKVLGRPDGSWSGHPVAGYEIHHGRAEPDQVAAGDERFLDGWRRGQVWGTMWHGTLENDAFRRAWLAAVAEASGSRWCAEPGAAGFADRRERMLETLGDAVRDHLDVDALLDLATGRRPRSATGPGTVPASGPAQQTRHPDPVDLDHHGDADLEPGLIDLAVNVRLNQPPDWLAACLTEALSDLARYPDSTAARAALAARHQVPAAAVLPTAGGAEAFTLVARALPGRYPVVVHPQFTESEVALRTAGRQPHRVLLDRASGFRLDPDAIPDQADLVLIGNPTNPTGVLHRAADIRRLCRPGRVVVVDEAFMDAVPGEPESLIGPNLTGLVVLRSLTKTWAIAGLRAGYLVGEPELVTRLARQQPPWSVGTLALTAMEACSTPAALAEAQRAANQLADRRRLLEEGLRGLGLTVAGPAYTPFLLVDTSAAGPASLRPALRARGYAVRRGETFPGLGPTWLRLAVRDEPTLRGFLSALADVLSIQLSSQPSLPRIDGPERTAGSAGCP